MDLKHRDLGRLSAEGAQTIAEPACLVSGAGYENTASGKRK
jgi:hypothetical protein